MSTVTVPASTSEAMDLVRAGLAYLAVTNVFALLRLLPMSDRDKDVEILSCSKIGVAGKPALLVLTTQCGNIDCGGLRYLIVGYGHF